MDEFDLPVTFKGMEEVFKVQLHITGYTYRLVVDVHGQSINFERDEEGNFRALLDYNDVENSGNVDLGLVKAIGVAIANIFN